MNSSTITYSHGSNRPPINYSMVKLLILKDWYLQRQTILWSLVGGAVALGVTVAAGKAGFTMGIILLVTVMIAVGAQLVMATIVIERKEQTLAFVMSLPISSREFTAAKILANLLIFLVPWTAITAGTVGVVLFGHGLAHGLVPFVTIMSTEILVSTCLIFAVALMTESQGWTVAAIVAGNLIFNLFGYVVGHIPSITTRFNSQYVVWNSTAVCLLLAEVGTAALLLGLTFVVQAKKTDFL